MKKAEEWVTLARNLAVVLFGTSLLAFSAVRAEAKVAMGPYLDLGSGSGSFEWDSDSFSFDVDSSCGAVGFALDSTASEISPYNYRLNIGLERQKQKDDYGETMDMGGLVIENVFGFALMRDRGLHWWAGPLLRIGFYKGETDTYYGSSGDRYQLDTDLLEFGVGVATGINVRVGPHTVLSPSAGIRFIGASGTGTIKNLDLRSQYEDDLSGSTTNLFVNFALLFD